MSWLLSTRLGRWLSIAAISLKILVITFSLGFRRGDQHRQARQERARLDAMRTKVQVDDKIARMTKSEARDRLKKWGRQE